MIFSYFDSDSKLEYVIDFSSNKIHSPGFMMAIWIQMEWNDGVPLRVLLHNDPIAIQNGEAQWQDHHIRKDSPFTSVEVRCFVQKLINNKAFM